MNLYQWALAQCLKEYSCGDIIVMAETVDQAREKARSQIETFLKEHRSWWYTMDGKVDPDYADDYDHGGFIKTFEKDLLLEPDLVEQGVIFIRGSE